MNGKSYFLDTNAAISLLKGAPFPYKLLEKANRIYLSVISYLEYMAYKNLSQADIDLFNQFISRIDVIPLDVKDQRLMNEIIKIRRTYKLKLPDCIIAASALANKATLITADKEMFVVKDVKMINLNDY